MLAGLSRPASSRSTAWAVLSRQAVLSRLGVLESSSCSEISFDFLNANYTFFECGTLFFAFLSHILTKLPCLVTLLAVAIL